MSPLAKIFYNNYKLGRITLDYIRVEWIRKEVEEQLEKDRQKID